MVSTVRVILILALVSLTGCTHALLGLTLAGTIANAVHSFYQVSDDVISQLALLCQDVAVMRLQQRGALDPSRSAILWYQAICNDLRPSNPQIDKMTPIWMAKGISKIK